MMRHAHIAACVLLFACDSSVPPPAGLDEPFSVYGVLNPTRTLQTLLVSPVDDRLEPLGASIDAVVTSTDLETGEVVAWRDSVSADALGQIEHVFVADFRPDYGSRHRIEIVRSDGKRSLVDVSVPNHVAVEQVDTGTRYQLVTVDGADVHLARVEITYGVLLFDAEADTLGPLSYYTYARAGETLREGWRVDVNLHDDYALAKSSYGNEFSGTFESSDDPACRGLGLVELWASVTVASEDWSPAQRDANVVAYDAAATNVENGLGFVAGGYDVDLAFVLSAEALRDTRFFDFMEGRRPGGCPAECLGHGGCGAE